MVQKFSASKSNVPSTFRKKRSIQKSPPASPKQEISTQNAGISFSTLFAFFLIFIIIPAIYFNVLEEKEEKVVPPTIESHSAPIMPQWPKTMPPKDGKQWHIRIVPEERVEKPKPPEKKSFKMQSLSSIYAQKAFVIEIGSYSSEQQAFKAAQTYTHPTKVINVGYKYKVIIGDFNTLMEADHYLQKSELKGFIYQMRTYKASGRRV